MTTWELVSWASDARVDGLREFGARYTLWLTFDSQEIETLIDFDNYSINVLNRRTPISRTRIEEQKKTTTRARENVVLYYTVYE